MQLKPTTLARYRAYVLDDLIPRLGFITLDDLNHHHIKAYALTQLGEGRGKVTVYRILSTLSNALGDARRDHRLRRNAALPMVFPRPRAAHRTIWTAGQAAQFLRHCHHADPLMADLCEVLIGTGMRKSEALGLHWQDVHLAARLLFVRWTLSAVDNNHLVLNAPKTRASKAWVALSDRVAHALAHRAAPATFRSTQDQDQPADGLVFTRNGRRLHPQYVLNRFHALCRAAGIPKIALHDLRHLAVTLAMDAGTEMAVVSETVRHSTFSTTVNLYHHLRGKAARGAVDGIARLLDHADQDAHHEMAVERASGTSAVSTESRTQLPYQSRPVSLSGSSDSGLESVCSGRTAPQRERVRGTQTRSLRRETNPTSRVVRLLFLVTFEVNGLGTQ